MGASNGDATLEKLWDMIKSIDVGMMTSLDDGHLRARPMWTLRDEGEKTCLFFFTRQSSHKMEELRANPEVGVAFSDPKTQTYVSVSGRAQLSRDPERMRRLWAEPMRTWFPEGLDDPDLAMLSVEIVQAEYWDSPSSAMVHLYGYVKASLTGKPPHPGDHGKLNMPRH